MESIAEKTEIKSPLYEINRKFNSRGPFNEVVDIIASDIDMVVAGTKRNGAGIMALTFLLTTPLTLLKVLHCLWTLIFDSPHQVREYTSLSQIYRDDFSTPEGIKNYSPEQVMAGEEEIEKFERCTHPYLKPQVEETMVEALITVRDSLIITNAVLTGYRVKTVNHSVPEEVLLQDAKTGELSKAYWTDYIDFGENMNKCLKDILPDKIKLKKIKECTYRCLEVPNGNLMEIENDLKRIFLQDNLRILIKESLV